MGIHKASKAEINDVLFRIPFNHHFSTWYIEMLIAVAYSLRYERLKNLEFSIKTTWLYEEGDIDGDSAAREIEAFIKEQVLDKVYGILSKLPEDLFEVSLGDDLEVNVSGIDDLVEDYLMGEPDDYYEEYRDWESDNLEIEYIFER